MAEEHYHKQSSGNGGTIAFIVGGLVVAVGLILFWMFGGTGGTASGPGADAAPSNIEINATADSDAAAAADEADGGDAASAGAASSAESGGADAGAAATAND